MRGGGWVVGPKAAYDLSQRHVYARRLERGGVINMKRPGATWPSTGCLCNRERSVSVGERERERRR